MRRSLFLALAITTSFVSCRSTEVETDSTPQPVLAGQPAPTITSLSVIPAGAILHASLNQTIGTKASKVGDRFYATVTEPLLTIYSEVVVPQGATVSGTITALDDSDHPGDQALIRLNFDQLTWGGRTRGFAADVITADVQLQREKKIDTIKAAGAGAAAGAVLGAVISGAELDKILAGAAIGAGAGTVLSLGLGDVEPSIPVGAQLTLRTSREVVLQ